jgi:hypothetical protein
VIGHIASRHQLKNVELARQMQAVEVSLAKLRAKFDDHEIKKANGLIVVPDIIVHHRGTPENLLVIEVKKSNTREDDEQDIQKLRAYRDSDLRYQYALFLKVVIGKEAPGIMRSQWI